MPSLHNALALKAAPQASGMAQRTAQHTWERPQLMVPGQARISSQGMSSQDTCTAETAADSPLHEKRVCSNLPFCSTSEGGMETIIKPLKNIK